MTLGEMAQSIAQEYGEFYEDPEVKDQYLRWTNESYKEVFGSAPWHFRNTNTNASLSSELTDVVPVNITGNGPITVVLFAGAVTPGGPYDGKEGTPLTYVPVERLVARPGTKLGIDIGFPKYWWYDAWNTVSESPTVRVYPRPGEIVEFLFYGLLGPQDLGEDSTLSIPEEFTPLVAYGVRRRVLQNDQNFAGAKSMEEEYAKLYKQLLLSWTGPMGEPSRLPAKRIKAVHQAPMAQGAGA